ncbi:hypothetical protein C1H71_18110 [Iodobacter fluviatilis]|uniref:Uncharacterized protein n=1 Tax=Iodobacter fluviatilis TaxID=537 RepID=A0A7G3GDR5_9NEIS|nr:hypothetical protein C1H71_18110 [Iodobacter fluviatilis]
MSLSIKFCSLVSSKAKYFVQMQCWILLASKLGLVGIQVGLFKLGYLLGSVDVSFAIALSRKTARHKACDEGNNGLLSRSITQ